MVKRLSGARRTFHDFCDSFIRLLCMLNCMPGTGNVINDLGKYFTSVILFNFVHARAAHFYTPRQNMRYYLYYADYLEIVVYCPRRGPWRPKGCTHMSAAVVYQTRFSALLLCPTFVKWFSIHMLNLKCAKWWNVEPFYKYRCYSYKVGRRIMPCHKHTASIPSVRPLWCHRKQEGSMLDVVLIHTHKDRW